MPELPEVETVVRGLRAELPGLRFVEVRLGKTDFIDDPIALSDHLPEARIVGIHRLGKFLDFELLAGTVPLDETKRFHLFVHLGMTGQLTIRQRGDLIAPHTHAFLTLDDGRELRYRDVRRFGRMFLVRDSEMTNFEGGMGREPLEIKFAEFRRLLGGRNARIKALLLDQSVLRGMGNIYADESLFRAGIHPARMASTIPTAKLAALHRAVRQVLNAAIRSRGSSISDYVDSSGKRGKFQVLHRVYRRYGQDCFQCGAGIRRMVVAGRTTHFCPRCQPAPRSSKARGNASRPGK